MPVELKLVSAIESHTMLKGRFLAARTPVLYFYLFYSDRHQLRRHVDEVLEGIEASRKA